MRFIRNILERRERRRRWAEAGANPSVIAVLEEFANQTQPQGPLLDLCFDNKGKALPLWLAFPDDPRASMGWRMGGGEDYKIEFGNWYRSLSDEARSEYRQFYPEPEGWEDFYAMFEGQ